MYSLAAVGTRTHEDRVLCCSITHNPTGRDSSSHQSVIMPPLMPFLQFAGCGVFEQSPKIWISDENICWQQDTLITTTDTRDGSCAASCIIEWAIGLMLCSYSWKPHTRWCINNSGRSQSEKCSVCTRWSGLQVDDVNNRPVLVQKIQKQVGVNLVSTRTFYPRQLGSYRDISSPALLW